MKDQQGRAGPGQLITELNYLKFLFEKSCVTGKKFPEIFSHSYDRNRVRTVGFTEVFRSEKKKSDV